MKQWWKISIGILAAILFITSGIGLYAVLRYPPTITLPISELDTLDVPYFDLKKIETSLRLELQPDRVNEKYQVMILSSEIRIMHYPYKSTSIVQSYKGYSLEDDALLCEPYLYTEYFREEGKYTTARAFENNQFAGLHLEGWEQYKQNDVRFEKCYVAVDRISTRQNKFSIIVINNKQIMYIDYADGKLTADYFLDELARILA
jgi:hypothetical protein